MENIDTVVIGAGVVGLAAALAVARRGHSVCVIERERRAGLAGSTHNSQVIHSGIYYPPESLKARHFVAGARMLYDFCATHDVPHDRCGKLIVAQDDHGIGSLEALYARGEANGVCSLRMVDQAFIRAREPHIRAKAALYAPDTGILDAEALVRTLARLCADHDAFVLPGSPLIGADTRLDTIELRTPAETMVARSVVNAAGLFADDVSAVMGGDVFRIYPCRGEYAELVPAKRPPARALMVGSDRRDYPLLRGAIVKLAHDDPAVAGRLLAALLPAQAVAIEGPLSYDVTIREAGTFGVAIGGDRSGLATTSDP